MPIKLSAKEKLETGFNIIEYYVKQGGCSHCIENLQVRKKEVMRALRKLESPLNIHVTFGFEDSDNLDEVGTEAVNCEAWVTRDEVEIYDFHVITKRFDPKPVKPKKV